MHLSNLKSLVALLFTGLHTDVLTKLNDSTEQSLLKNCQGILVLWNWNVHYRVNKILSQMNSVSALHSIS